MVVDKGLWSVAIGKHSATKVSGSTVAEGGLLAGINGSTAVDVGLASVDRGPVVVVGGPMAIGGGLTASNGGLSASNGSHSDGPTMSMVDWWWWLITGLILAFYFVEIFSSLGNLTSLIEEVGMKIGQYS